MYETIEKCRVCGNSNLVPIIDLGLQQMDGVFPSSIDQPIESMPLEVVKCHSDNGDSCGLVQLKHGFKFDSSYWENYGYRSGLNQSMVSSLRSIAQKAMSYGNLNAGDIIIDIGSNDGLLLKSFPRGRFRLAGFDPGGKSMKKHYPDEISLVSELFSEQAFVNTFGGKKAKIATSIAMLYNIASPLNFMRDVFNILDDNGLWIFEQSYMPSMLENTAYDTICHEHLSYFALKQINWMAERSGFRIVDVEFNPVNGGSFLVVAAKRAAPFKNGNKTRDRVLLAEKARSLDSLLPYKEFENKVSRHRHEIRGLLGDLRSRGKTILGYGASTKGNVLLQFCGISRNEIPFIAEINEDKIGRYTPSTRIPIISEKEAFGMKPDYLFVLPWHFKDSIISKEKQFLENGGRIIFPLPGICIVDKTCNA